MVKYKIFVKKDDFYMFEKIKNFIIKILYFIVTNTYYSKDMSYSEYNRKLLFSRFGGAMIDILLCALCSLITPSIAYFLRDLMSINGFCTVVFGLMALIPGALMEVYELYFPLLCIIEAGLIVLNILAVMICSIFKKRFGGHDFSPNKFLKYRLFFLIGPLGIVYIFFLIFGGICGACISSTETYYDENGKKITIQR